MNRRDIPVYELSAYRQSSEYPGIHVAGIQDSIQQRRSLLQPHYHHFFQVFLMSGRSFFMHDFVEYRITGAVLAFASPGQVHVVKPGRGFRGIFVSFTQDFFDGTTPPPSKLLEYPFFFSNGAPPFVRLEHKEFLRYQELFAEMQSEFDANLAGASDVLRALLQIIFARAARHFPEGEQSSEPSRPAQLMREFRLAVETRFREFTSLSDYAALLKVTVNHLNDTVREQTGQSAGEIIRQRRLLDAKRLLLHSDMSVSEVGYHLGFEDPSYFSRFFRRYAGVSPAEFRAGIREKYQQNGP
ncbi:helix-turn-helix domain-containing protein [Verrucomicrobiota bacterium sgz303538]